MELSLPYRGTFYYAWFGKLTDPNWSQSGITPACKYKPFLGFYDLDETPDNLAVIHSHVEMMAYAKINLMIYSWWGPGSDTDKRLQEYLDALSGTDMAITLYIEPAPTSTQDMSDTLNYIYDHYAMHPNFATISGRPVLFFYSRAVPGPIYAEAWVRANAGKFYLNFNVFGNYLSYGLAVDGWHQYNPDHAFDHQPKFSFTVSPGFWKYNEAAPRLARNPTDFETNVKAMVASGEPFQGVETFNEWGEGSSVENAREWDSTSEMGEYLDILHYN